MDQKTFDDYLKDRYLPEIAWYDTNSLHNQVWYRTLQSALIVLSASTPVIIALAQKTPSGAWIQRLSLITSVLVAIIATTLKTFKFQENWINYRTTCETLKKEIHFYHAGVDEYADGAGRESTFVKRVESLISRENTLWLTTIKEKPGEQKTS